MTAAVLVFNISCQKSDSSSKKKNKKLFERKGDLIYLQNSNTPYTGEIKDTLQDRILDYYTVKGVKDGDFKISYLDGNPQMEGMIKNGLNEGEWKYYYDGGNIESRGNFKQDTVEGKWTWYFKNGKIKEEGNFKAGKKEGIWLEYNEQGKIVERKKYRNDMEIAKH